jgi:predicted PurR-regulated permease PerM
MVRRPQFDRVLTVTSQTALLILGVLAMVIALALGKDILAPLSLAIFAGLVFGPVADRLERYGIVPALSSAVVVLGFIAGIAVATSLFAGPISDWVARGPALWAKLQTQLAGFKEPLQSLGAIQGQLKSLMGSDAAMTVEVQNGGPVQDVALMAPALLASVLLFLAGLYFFLATRHHIRIAALSLCFSRRTRWRTAHVFRDIELKVSRFLLSAAAINCGVGVATTLAT